MQYKNNDILAGKNEAPVAHHLKIPENAMLMSRKTIAKQF